MAGRAAFARPAHRGHSDELGFAMSGENATHTEELGMIRRWSSAMVIAMGLVVAGVPSAHAGIVVQITPAASTVAPGAEFEVKLRIIGTGSAFNALHAVVVYDPNALTPVPLSPVKTQIDSVFSTICSNSFYKFVATPGTGLDSADVSLLCNSVSATGPGPVVKLHFRASNTPQVTQLYIRGDAHFDNAGVIVSGLSTSGAVVNIGSSSVGVGPAAPAAGLALTAGPNPTAGDVRLDFGRPLPANGDLAVHDIAGRLMRRYDLPAGARSAIWDGRDTSGVRVPPGQYMAVLRCGLEMRFTRLTRLR